MDALRSATLGGITVHPGDLVAADDDGVLFIPAKDARRVWKLTQRIQATELEQVKQAKAGNSLCKQFDVPGFLAARKHNADLTFRAHLRERGMAIEE